MSMDLVAPGSKVSGGRGGGTAPNDPFIQDVGVLGYTASDGSGTVATGGSAQTLFSGVAPVHGFIVQNNSAAEMWINDAGAAAEIGGPCFNIPAGVRFTTPPGYAPAGAVSLFCVLTGAAFAARTW